MHTVNTQLQDPSTAIALSQTTSSAKLDRITKLDVTAVITGANPSNIAFTATAATDICATASAHGFTAGVKVQFTTTTTLPAGLSTSTDYYLIVLSTTTFKVASSQANALAGTAIDLTDAGTGVHTVAVVTTIAGTIKLQKTNSRVDEVVAGTAVWVDLDDTEVDNGNNSLSFSATSTKNWACWNVGFRGLRAVIAVTSGTVTADVRLHGKSN